VLQFLGKNINCKYDLLVVKVKVADFVKPLKFGKIDSEKLVDSIFELTRKLVFNQSDAHIYLNYCKQERRKGLEIYIYNKSVTMEKTHQILNSNYDISGESIFLDKNFFDSFEFRQDPRLGAEVHGIKLLK
jgi:hypothetical protein